MKKSLLILSIILTLIVSGGIVTAVIVNNKMQRDNQEAARAAAKHEKEEDQKKLDGCLVKANAEYYSSIRFYQTGSAELDMAKDYSQLPISQDDQGRAESQKEEDTSNCYKRYDR